MRRAFTLIELLVVITILAALIAILVPTLGRVKETSRRAICATNLKSQGDAFGVYATQFKDKLPVFTNTQGYWLHDEPFEFAETLLNISSHIAARDLPATSQRRWFYCPSNYLSAEANKLWRYGDNHNSKYRALGYTYLNDRGDANSSTGVRPNMPNLPPLPPPAQSFDPNVTNGRKYPPLGYHAYYTTTPSAADSELAFDEVLTSDNGGNSGPNSWWAPRYDVPPAGNEVPAGTSHLRGKLAAGMNVLCFDGHVVWRDFPNSAANKDKIVGIRNGKIPAASFSWLVNP